MSKSLYIIPKEIDRELLHHHWSMKSQGEVTAYHNIVYFIHILKIHKTFNFEQTVPELGQLHFNIFSFT